MGVVAGNNITIETTLQYDSNPFSAPHTGVMYTPLDVSVHVFYFTTACVNAWQITFVINVNNQVADT